MYRRRQPARARPLTAPNPHTRPRRLSRHLIRPHTPSGGGQAHAWAPLCCCVRVRVGARWPARIFDADRLPPQPPPPTPCSRYKCRGARAWSGWARRGDRAYGTTTDITIPHCEYLPLTTTYGMGEAAEAAGDGGAVAGDGGTRDARAVRRRCRASRPAAQHTATGRRVRTGRASTVTSPLSASRADEKQLPASTEQVCERRARVGWRDGGGGAARGGGSGRGDGGGGGDGSGHGGGWQEGRAAAESDAVVGAHGRAAGGSLPADQCAAAVRDGAAPCYTRARTARTARRVTPHSIAPPHPSIISRLHSIIGTIRLAGAGVHARPGVL